MKKYTRKELFKMDAVEIYKLVLSGDIKKFPDGFWTQLEAKQNAAKCVRFLIEEVLRLSNEEVKEQLSIKLLKEHKLGGMLKICFNGSPYESINLAYPNKFKPWEFKTVPNGYWNDINNAIQSTKWLIEEKLKLSDEELKEKLSIKLFQVNGLNTILGMHFDGSPYKAINAAYPGKFKPWEFKVTGLNYWLEEENRINAIRWLIEDKLKLSDEQIKEQLCLKLFIDEGFNGLLTSYFNGSPYEAINVAYPGKFKPWEFNQVHNGCWKDIKNGIQATKWLIEEKLKLSDEELKKQLSYKLFYENGLSGMLSLCFNSSPYEAIDTVYPNKFKEEDFKNYKYFKSYKNNRK